MTEVNITPEAGTETQEQIDAMVAKSEGKETPPASTEQKPERPDWLPEKFATPEDMAKAYAEMEKKQGSGETEQNTDGETNEEANAEADAAVTGVVEAAGLDMQALGQKITEKGDLDDSDYEALAKQGVSKEMVQQYVSGQQAIAAKLVSDLHSQVGGEEQFNELIGWAAENLSKDEIEAFNATVDNGTPAAVKLALKGLEAQRTAAEGSKPNLIGGTRQGATGGDVYRSTAEVTAAMSDPRYTKDAAYRADVMAKLGRSNVM